MKLILNLFIFFGKISAIILATFQNSELISLKLRSIFVLFFVYQPVQPCTVYHKNIRRHVTMSLSEAKSHQTLGI